MKTAAMALLARGRPLLPLFFATFVVILVAGCAPIAKPVLPTATSAVSPTPSSAPSATPAATGAASPTDVPTPEVPTATPLPAAPTASPTPAAASPTMAARAATNADSVTSIEQVIRKANDAQALAFNHNNPSLMKDTATSDYYSHLLQINDDLASNGVTAIKLIKLEWGPVNVLSASTAQATTFETWETSFDDGSTEQSRDRNVYQLVLDGTGWKIQTDDHPDAAGTGASGSAAPAPSGTPVAQPTPPESIVPAGPGESRNWSGYNSDGGTFTSVSGTWTVPQPTGGGVTASAATWVGIGGVQRRDLIQAGTEEIVLGSGTVRYNAWIEMLPDVSHTVPLTVHPGDSVSVSIAEQSGDNWLITFLDNTTSQSYKKTVTYQSSLSSAEWVEEAPSGGRRIVPLESFGTVSFTGGTTVENGKTLSIAQSGAKPITMIDLRGDVIAQPSKLGSDGGSFTVTRVGPAPASLPVPSSRRRFG